MPEGEKGSYVYNFEEINEKIEAQENYYKGFKKRFVEETTELKENYTNLFEMIFGKQKWFFKNKKSLILNLIASEGEFRLLRQKFNELRNNIQKFMNILGENYLGNKDDNAFIDELEGLFKELEVKTRIACKHLVLGQQLHCGLYMDHRLCDGLDEEACVNYTPLSTEIPTVIDISDKFSNPQLEKLRIEETKRLDGNERVDETMPINPKIPTESSEIDPSNSQCVSCGKEYTGKYPLIPNIPWECDECYNKSGSDHGVERVQDFGGASPSPDSEMDYHQIHELKSLPKYFQPLLERKKTFEIRDDDRGFKIGDTLLLKEYVPRNSPNLSWGYTGREIAVEITYILRADDSYFSFLDDFVIIGIKF